MRGKSTPAQKASRREDAAAKRAAEKVSQDFIEQLTGSRPLSMGALAEARRRAEKLVADLDAAIAAGAPLAPSDDALAARKRRKSELKSKAQGTR